MNALKTIAEVLQFVAVEVIPFANVIVKSIKKWTSKKQSKKNENEKEN